MEEKSLRQKLAEANEKQKEYDSNAMRYNKAKHRFKIYIIVLMSLGAFLMFTSIFSFFFDTVPGSEGTKFNVGLIQFPLGLLLSLTSLLVSHSKNKKFLLISTSAYALLLVYGIFGNTKYRASITNFWGIPIEAYTNLRFAIIFVCLAVFVLNFFTLKMLNEFEKLSQCEGYPHFSMRCNKLGDYMPSEYTTVSERRSTPDTLSEEDIQKLSEINENSSQKPNYTPGVMDVIDPIPLDDESDNAIK